MSGGGENSPSPDDPNPPTVMPRGLRVCAFLRRSHLACSTPLAANVIKACVMGRNYRSLRAKMRIISVSYRCSESRTVNDKTYDSAVELTAQVDESDSPSEALALLVKRAEHALQENIAAKNARLEASILADFNIQRPAVVPGFEGREKAQAPATAAPVPANTPQNTAGRWGVSARYPAMQTAQGGK